MKGPQVTRHRARRLRHPRLALAVVALALTGCGSSAGAVAAAPPVAAPAPASASASGKAASPDFGPNVFVFSPGTPREEIQLRVDQVFAAQEEAQFGPGRFALLFLPGRYEVDVNVGYFTQVLGLGLLPGDTVIRGAVHVEADWFGGNATHNFWRGAENLAVEPAGGADRWAVSQAAPYRRMHVRGDLLLDDGGWSSGGFFADVRVDGAVRSGSQQQWYSRSSRFGQWVGSNWNMVFQGVVGAPSGGFPTPPYTTLPQSPVVREKPFLYVDRAGAYQVFVPALRKRARGTTWEQGKPAGTSLPLARFHVAREGAGAAELNAALARGRHLLLTPGIYHLDEPLRVTRPNTVVLGLGLATLQAEHGVTALRVADVPGVKIAGVLVEAGTTESDLLVEVGPPGASRRHAANPISLHDLFVRIGGAHAGRARTSVAIHSHHVIGDHLWLWRGDHGAGIGWRSNTADTGLVVEGDDVTMYALFVEHYQKRQTVWNGERGRTYFFQNELPYDPPDQASWMDGAVRGYAAYQVGDSVTRHEAWGLGSYCYFRDVPSLVADRAFAAPRRPGVTFRHLTTVSLGGVGTIARVINETGEAASPAHHVSTLVAYP